MLVASICLLSSSSLQWFHNPSSERHRRLYLERKSFLRDKIKMNIWSLKELTVVNFMLFVWEFGFFGSTPLAFLNWKQYLKFQHFFNAKLCVYFFLLVFCVSPSLKKNYASVINSFVILYCYLLNMGCLWWSLYAENFFHKLFIYLFFYISFNFHFLLLIKLQYFFLPRVVLFLLHFLFVSHYRQYTHVK